MGTHQWAPPTNPRHCGRGGLAGLRGGRGPSRSPRWSRGSRRPASRPWASSPARLSRAGGSQWVGDGAGLAKTRQEGPGRPGRGVRRWRAAAFPARSAEKAGGPGWPRPRDTGMSGRPARSLGLRKHRPSWRRGQKSKVMGQLRWFCSGAQRDNPSLGAILASGACRQPSTHRPSLPHVT